MKWFAKALILFLTVLLTLACSTLMPTANKEETPQEAAHPESQVVSEVLFSDDFSDPVSGWEENEFETGSVGYGAGYYTVISYGDGMSMWGGAQRNIGDIRINVDAEQISGPTDNGTDYGVACRLQEDGAGYYLLISGDGFYSIFFASSEEQVAAGEDDFIPMVDWVYSDVINQGNAANHIEALCSGSHLALTVNGALLAETNDSTYASGDIAFSATSYTSTPAEVHFTNLVATQP